MKNKHYKFTKQPRNFNSCRPRYPDKVNFTVDNVVRVKNGPSQKNKAARGSESCKLLDFFVTELLTSVGVYIHMNIF